MWRKKGKERKEVLSNWISKNVNNQLMYWQLEKLCFFELLRLCSILPHFLGFIWEFDPGSGWTLATWIRHASRTILCEAQGNSKWQNPNDKSMTKSQAQNLTFELWVWFDIWILNFDFLALCARWWRAFCRTSQRVFLLSSSKRFCR